jgi:flavin reductase (DIM6/NTAB) family NADH-FMN oxidoreductase RutF
MAMTTSPEVPPTVFREAMRHHAKGVAVITAGTEKPIGFCATSLASVSLDPPTVSFTVGLRTRSWPTVETARHAIVHLLADSQEEVARNFARPGTGKFAADTRWHRGALGLPVLDGVLAWLALALISHFPVGDHALVIGRVIETGPLADRPMAGEVHGLVTAQRPLIHHDGAFTRLVVPVIGTTEREFSERKDLIRAHEGGSSSGQQSEQSWPRAAASC